MSIHIHESTMDSGLTKHSVRRDDHSMRWQVSWLPGRLLDHNQAAAAMAIAKIIATTAATTMGDSKDSLWRHLDDWAAELGLRCSEAPIHTAADPKDRESTR